MIEWRSYLHENMDRNAVAITCQENKLYELQWWKEFELNENWFVSSLHSRTIAAVFRCPCRKRDQCPTTPSNSHPERDGGASSQETSSIESRATRSSGIALAFLSAGMLPKPTHESREGSGNMRTFLIRTVHTSWHRLRGACGPGVDGREPDGDGTYDHFRHENEDTRTSSPNQKKTQPTPPGKSGCHHLVCSGWFVSSARDSPAFQRQTTRQLHLWYQAVLTSLQNRTSR